MELIRKIRKGKPKSQLQMNLKFMNNKLKFGKPLDEVISAGCILPSLLKVILSKLYIEAPHVVHVFGVTPPAAICRKLKLSLVRGSRIKWNKVNVHTVAAVLKNFLRCLPNCLLFPDYYHEWINMNLNLDSPAVLSHARRLIQQLPETHQVLLNHILLIFRRICQSVPATLSTPIIVGHFVGPYLLWNPELGFCEYPSLGEHLQLAKIVKYLIIHVAALCENWHKDFVLTKDNDNESFNWDEKDATSTISTLLFSIEENTPSVSSDVNNKNLSRYNTTSEIAEGFKKSHTDHGVLTEDVDTEKISDISKTSVINEEPARGKLKPWCISKVRTEDLVAIPSWLSQFPNWKMDGDDLPKWISRSNFTMNMNDLTSITEVKSNHSRKLVFSAKENYEGKKRKVPRLYSNLDCARKLINIDF